MTLPCARPATYRISRIDDPEGTSTIIAGHGTLDRSALIELWDAAEQLPRVASVHLDLVNTTIPRGPWMAELEAFGEALEAAGLHVRIVGIDPAHPDLRRK